MPMGLSDGNRRLPRTTPNLASLGASATAGLHAKTIGNLGIGTLHTPSVVVVVVLLGARPAGARDTGPPPRASSFPAPSDVAAPPGRALRRPSGVAMTII